MGRLARVGVSEVFLPAGAEIKAVAFPPKEAVFQPGETIARLRLAGQELEVPSPIGGLVLAVNTLLEKEPGRVGSDPYNTGWLVILRPRKVDEKVLFSAKEYLAHLSKGSE